MNNTARTPTRIQSLFARLNEKTYNAGFRPFDFGVYPDCQTLLAAGEEYRELLSLKAEVERLRAGLLRIGNVKVMKIDAIRDLALSLVSESTK